MSIKEIFSPGMNKAPPPKKPRRDPDAPPLIAVPTVPGDLIGLELENRIAELEQLENRTQLENRELGMIKFTLCQHQAQFNGEKNQELQEDFKDTRDEIFSYVDQISEELKIAEQNAFFAKITAQANHELVMSQIELIKRLSKELEDEKSARIALTERLISLEKEGGKNVK